MSKLSFTAPRNFSSFKLFGNSLNGPSVSSAFPVFVSLKVQAFLKQLTTGPWDTTSQDLTKTHVTPKMLALTTSFLQLSYPVYENSYHFFKHTVQNCPSRPACSGVADYKYP